jgi:hypothetical protein
MVDLHLDSARTRVTSHAAESASSSSSSHPIPTSPRHRRHGPGLISVACRIATTLSALGNEWPEAPIVAGAISSALRDVIGLDNSRFGIAGVQQRWYNSKRIRALSRAVKTRIFQPRGPGPVQYCS